MIAEDPQAIRLPIFRDRTIFRDNFWPGPTCRTFRAAGGRPAGGRRAAAAARKAGIMKRSSVIAGGLGMFFANRTECGL